MRKEEKEGRKKRGLRRARKNVIMARIRVVGPRSRTACYGCYEYLFWLDFCMLNIYMEMEISFNKLSESRL